jgi:uncharacterized membrane protein YGL010W
MSETDQWLSTYEHNHRAIRFAPAYWLAVPMLVLGTVGLLWSLPVPQALTQISPLLNWGTLFLMAAMVYYFIISIPLALGMLPVMFGITAFETWLARTDAWVSPAAILMTAASVGGLYASHYAGGGLRAVCRDIQLMMIAPVWMLSVLYRNLGIPR